MDVTLEKDEYSRNDFGVFAVVLVNGIKIGVVEIKNNVFGVLKATGGCRLFFNTKEDAAKAIIESEVEMFVDKKQYADEKINELGLLLQ